MIPVAEISQMVAEAIAPHIPKLQEWLMVLLENEQGLMRSLVESLNEVRSPQQQIWAGGVLLELLAG
jgi:hypothetical protein